MEYKKRDHHLEGNTLEIGVYHNLEILRETHVGLFLGDDKGNEVLLPNKYSPENYQVGGKLKVFVYLDSGERHIATTLEPKIVKGQFACLKCQFTNKNGSFLDMGLEKDLFVPFKEQEKKMEADKYYIVYMYLDEDTNRLTGSNKLKKFLEFDNIRLEKNQQVDLLVDKRSDLGVNVIIDNKYRGFIFNNQIFKPLRYGMKTKGFVKEVREDNKIDITLQVQGHQSIDINADFIIDKLEENMGFLPFNDKSSPEEIKDILGMSKKLFKKSIGTLYKQKLIDIKEDGIYLLGYE